MSSSFSHFVKIFLSYVLCATIPTSAAEMANLTAITWSHGTNNQSLLNEVLSSEIQMIECDIVYGTLIGDETNELQPIMAHPPETTSDISLHNFLNQVLNFNSGKTKEEQKGVKLDFKSTDVFQNSLPMLIELWGIMDYPVWINADIYRGPLNNTSSTPVDATSFFCWYKKSPERYSQHWLDNTMGMEFH